MSCVGEGGKVVGHGESVLGGSPTAAGKTTRARATRIITLFLLSSSEYAGVVLSQRQVQQRRWVGDVGFTTRGCNGCRVLKVEAFVGPAVGDVGEDEEDGNAKDDEEEGSREASHNDRVGEEQEEHAASKGPQQA